MLEDLKIGSRYDGFIFLAEARRNPPILVTHRHAELELNLVVEGSITYVVEGKRQLFQSGSLLWIFPSQRHQLVDRTLDARYYVAVFKPRMIARVCRGEKYTPLRSMAPGADGVMSRLLEKESVQFLHGTMDSLMEDALDPDLLNREAGFGLRSNFRFSHHDPDALNAGLHYLLIFCWRHYLGGTQNAHPLRLHPGVRKAVTLLGRRESPDSLGQLAGECGLSTTYLSRLFLKEMGISVSHYRNAARLSHFMELWHGPDRLTLLEMVYQAGFGSYAQFFKVFRQSYGQSPRAYLRSGD